MLGTAQLGLSYGVANAAGKIGLEDAKAILGCATVAGINTLDTAISYGESESRLGAIGVDQWRIVTKLPAVPDGCTDIAAWINESVDFSMSRLRVSKIYGLLLHRPSQLLDSYGSEYYRALLALKDSGKVEKIGISIYSPDELDTLWPNFNFDLVQAPFNVFDRRLQTTGWLDRLNQNSVEVHVRSVFLQGLLLMEAANLPKYFHSWAWLWEAWHRWLKENTISPLGACLGFALAHDGIQRVVVGVDSVKQLTEIAGSDISLDVLPPDALSSQDLDLINPVRWNLQ